jgi:hypothetical protein
VNLLNRDVYDIIKRHYYTPNQNRGNSEYSFGFGLIHYALIRNVRPERVLCVGSLKGYMPALCALACKDEGRGHVEFVDEGGLTWGGGGRWQALDEQGLHDYWKPLGVEDYIETHVCRIEDYSLGQYQYVHIDADHSYEGAKSEFALIWPHLDRGGLYTFHDINWRLQSAWGRFGVKDFWKELGGEKLALPISAGLGIVRKLRW